MADIDNEPLDQLPPDQKTEGQAASNVADKIELPYANSVYYKGIFGFILTLSIFGFIYGLYLMNIAFKRSSEMLRDYDKSPNTYTKKSVEKVRIGRRWAWITLVVWLGEILVVILV